MGLLSDDPFEHGKTISRLCGHDAAIYWPVLTCNVFIPQLLWSRWVRTNVWMLFVLSIVINLGMWLERLMIVVSSLNRDFLPSSWGSYWPTIWDWATFAGSFGLFLTLFLIFIRFAPAIAIADVRELIEPRRESTR